MGLGHFLVCPSDTKNQEYYNFELIFKNRKKAHLPGPPHKNKLSKKLQTRERINWKGEFGLKNAILEKRESSAGGWSHLKIRLKIDK